MDIDLNADPDLSALRVANAQHGVVTTQQLDRCGISAPMRSTRLKKGRLTRVHRGVYAWGGIRLTRRGRMMAAVLAIGQDAMISGYSALELWGIKCKREEQPTVVTSRDVATPVGVNLRQSNAVYSTDRFKRDGIPVAGCARALIDVAASADKYLLANLLHECAYLKLLNYDRLDRLVLSGYNFPGRGQLVKAIQMHLKGSAGTKSGLERRFLGIVARMGVPMPEINVKVWAYGHEMEVDVFWPHLDLVVEIDGAGHDRVRTKLDDEERDGLLIATGYSVLRFTADDINSRQTWVRKTLRDEIDAQLDRGQATLMSS